MIEIVLDLYLYLYLYPYLELCLDLQHLELHHHFLALEQKRKVDVPGSLRPPRAMFFSF